MGFRLAPLKALTFALAALYFGEHTNAQTDNCSRMCIRSIQYVCATNGKTYDNLCGLQMASCYSNNSFSFASNGPCATDPRESFDGVQVQPALNIVQFDPLPPPPEVLVSVLSVEGESTPMPIETLAAPMPVANVVPLPPVAVEGIASPVPIASTVQQPVIDAPLLPPELQPLTPPTLPPLTSSTTAPVQLFPEVQLSHRLGFLRNLNGGIITKAFPAISSTPTQALEPTVSLSPPPTEVPMVGSSAPMVVAPPAVIPRALPKPTVGTTTAPLVVAPAPVLPKPKPPTKAAPPAPLPPKLTPIPKPTPPSAPPKITPARPRVTVASFVKTAVAPTPVKPAPVPAKGTIKPATAASTTPTYALCETAQDCASALGGKSANWYCVRPMRCRPVKCFMTQAWNPTGCGPKECPPSANGMSVRQGYCRPSS